MSDEAQPESAELRPGEQVYDLRLTAALSVAISVLFGAAVAIFNLVTPGNATSDESSAGWLALILGIAGSFALFAFPAMWLYLARSNLDAFPEAKPRWSPGWTIAAWFIPVAKFVLVPWLIAEVARHSLSGRVRTAGVLLGVAWPLAFQAVLLIDSGLPAELGLVGLTWRPDRDAPWRGVSVTAASLVFVACQVAVIVLVTRAQHRRIAAGRALVPAAVAWTSAE